MQDSKIPTHILYDRRVIDDDLILKLAPQVFSEAELKPVVELRLIAMGDLEQMDPSGKSSPGKVDRQVDLRGALERLISDYKALGKKGVGTRNPEILILLGAYPIEDWVEVGRIISSSFLPLIVTYWFNGNSASSPSRQSIEHLLTRISPADPNTGAPRHRIMDVKAQEMPSILQDILTKLKDRLLQKVRSKPGFLGNQIDRRI